MSCQVPVPPVFNYANWIAQFPEFTGIPQSVVQAAWTLGGNWFVNNYQASWGINNTAQLQLAADLMGAVICKQLFGTGAEYTANANNTTADNAPGAVESATEGSVTANFQLPDIGTSAFSSMLLASPPYGRLLLALLQIQAGVSPYIGSCRPGSAFIPP